MDLFITIEAIYICQHRLDYAMINKPWNLSGLIKQRFFLAHAKCNISQSTPHSNSPLYSDSANHAASILYLYHFNLLDHHGTKRER